MKHFVVVLLNRSEASASSWLANLLASARRMRAPNGVWVSTVQPLTGLFNAISMKSHVCVITISSGKFGLELTASGAYRIARCEFSFPYKTPTWNQWIDFCVREAWASFRSNSWLEMEHIIWHTRSCYIAMCYSNGPRPDNITPNSTHIWGLPARQLNRMWIRDANADFSLFCFQLFCYSAVCKSFTHSMTKHTDTFVLCVLCVVCNCDCWVNSLAQRLASQRARQPATWVPRFCKFFEKTWD